MKEIDDFYFSPLVKFNEEDDSADKYMRRIEEGLNLGELDSCMYYKLQISVVFHNNFEDYFSTFLKMQKLFQISNDLYRKVNKKEN